MIFTLMLLFCGTISPIENRTATLEFAESLLTWNDFNPIHQEEAELLNNLLNQSIQLEIKVDYNSNKILRDSILEQLYLNSTDMMEDSYDIRRHNWRRSMMFLCLNLISEQERKSIFIEYSKFSLSLNENEPFVNEQLKPYLGILLVELVYLNDSGYRNQVELQITRLNELLNANKSVLSKSTIQEVNSIIDLYK